MKYILGILIHHFLICKNISKKESMSTFFRSTTPGIFKTGHAVRVNYLVTITLFHGWCITFSRVQVEVEEREKETKRKEKANKRKKRAREPAN